MIFKKIVEAISSHEHEIIVSNEYLGKILYKGKLKDMNTNLLLYNVVSVQPDKSCYTDNPEKYAGVPVYKLPLIIKIS